jgi:microcystin-dependent protein
MPTEVQIYKDKTIVGADIVDNSIPSDKLATTSNGRGTRTITENAPSSTDGQDGDIWYVIDPLSQSGGIAGAVTNGVYTVGDQTIGGTKTFTNTIAGSITGNAATASNLTGSPNITVGTVTASSFVKSGGTASQFLKADGSVDSNTYITQSVPTGAVFHFAASTAPTGYLKANGDVVPNGSGSVQGITANFSALYAILGETYGAPGKLPDLRGEFIRGWDDARGVDAGRTFGSAQADLAKPVSHTHNVPFVGSNIIPAWAAGTDAYGSLQPTETQCNSTTIDPDGGIQYNVSYYNWNLATSGPSTASGAETRPRNVALLACIKY